VDHELFEDEAWKVAPIQGLKEMARDQLGTVVEEIITLIFLRMSRTAFG